MCGKCLKTCYLNWLRSFNRHFVDWRWFYLNWFSLSAFRLVDYCHAFQITWILIYLIPIHCDRHPYGHGHHDRIHSSNGRYHNCLFYRRIYSDRVYFQRRRLVFWRHLYRCLIVRRLLSNGLNRRDESSYGKKIFSLVMGWF